MYRTYKTILVVFTLLTGWSEAQNFYTTSNWTWISGSTSFNQASTYGTLSVENSANVPSARYYHVMVFNPNNNAILVFGGQTSLFFNDLWSYNISTNNWAWIGGSSSTNQVSTYGTIRVEAASNVPGGRGGSFGAFDPITNSLYIFGGDGYATTASNGRTSDLWRFRLSTRQWTWMSGNTAINVASVYGTLGQESASSLPGGRAAGAMVFHQATYSLYMYGGGGLASTLTDGFLGDLWRYNLTSGNWAALPVSQTTVSLSATYNTFRVEGATTWFGGRYYHSAAVADDTIWFFGGVQPVSSMNDFFRYNITTRRMTWMGGSSSCCSAGSYGTLFQESSSNSPMARTTHTLQYHAPSNCLVLHAGADSSGNRLVDVWRYNLTSLQWALVSGSNVGNVAANFGTRMVSLSTNSPGGRTALSSTISTLTGVFYIFGAYRNDLWMYDIGASVEPVVTTTTTTTTTTSSTTSTTSSSTTTTTSTIDPGSFDSSTLTVSSFFTSISLLGDSGTASLSGTTTVSSLTSVTKSTTTTTVRATSTPLVSISPTAPAGTVDASTIMYAAAGGGGAIFLIVVVIAIVLVRRKSAAKPPVQQFFAPTQDFQTFPQANMPVQLTMTPYTGYSTQSIYGNQPSMQNTNMAQQSMYSQSPMVNTMTRQSMYSQPMPQQGMGMGIPMNTNMSMGIPMNTNMSMGIPMNTNMGMGMNGGIQQSMVQSPTVNNGQGAGTIIVDDNEAQVNYNQFQY